MTKIIRQDLALKYYTDVDCEDNEAFEDVNIFSLESLKEVFPDDVKFNVITPYSPADYFTFGSREFVSERLKNSLEEEQVKAEFFPVEVTYKGTPFRYYFLHYMCEIACVDAEKSVFKLFEDGDVDTIERLVLKEGKIKGEHLFSVAGASYLIRAISDSLAEKLRKQKVTGIKFYESTELWW